MPGLVIRTYDDMTLQQNKELDSQHEVLSQASCVFSQSSLKEGYSIQSNTKTYCSYKQTHTSLSHTQMVRTFFNYYFIMRTQTL